MSLIVKNPDIKIHDIIPIFQRFLYFDLNKFLIIYC